MCQLVYTSLFFRCGYCKYDHYHAYNIASDIYIQFQMQRIVDSLNNATIIAIELINSRPIENALVEGMSLLKEPAQKGDAKAQFVLGYCYGGYVTWHEDSKKMIDHEKEAYWFSKAAEQGIIGAMYYLANCYSEGKGVEKSSEKEYYWNKKAALSGFPESMLRLGDLYRDGVIERQPFYKKVLDRNIDSALYWWNKAYEVGNLSIKQQAEKRLQKLYN